MAERNVEAMFRLSPSQQGILFEALAFPGSGIHIEQVRWRIDGPLDHERFADAWRRLTSQRSILRTGFWHKDLEEPLQFVLRSATVPIAFHDLGEERDSESAIGAWVDSDRRRGFELHKAPLVRVAVFRSATATHHIVLTFHHILLDGWSVPLLARDVLTAFEGVELGRDKPYHEYVEWFERQDREKAEAFWKRRLAAFEAPTPLGRVSDQQAGDGYGVLESVVSERTAAALQSITRGHQVTLNTVMQGGWSILLSRYSGNGDVVFGITVSGRPPSLPGSPSMLGLFVNTVPFRVKIPSSGALWPWLQSIQRAAAEQSEFEIWSAGQIHQWSGLAPAKPLFESILVFENYPFEGKSDMSIGPVEAGAIGAQTRYPLTLLATPGRALTLRAIFRRERIGEATVRNILNHFRGALDRIAGDVADIAAVRDSIPAGEIPSIAPAARTMATGTPPRTITEQKLTRIWAEVLGVDRVGVDDGFFDLGGHSLLVPRLVARIRDEFHREVPLNALLERPAVSQMAAWLDDRASSRSTPAHDCLLVLQAEGSRRPLFWIPPAAGTPVCYLEQARLLGPDQPSYGLQCPGLGDGHKPLNRIEDLAALFVEAMRGVQRHGPYRLAGWSFGGLVAFEMARVIGQQGDEVELLAFLDTGVVDTTDRRVLNQMRLSLFQVKILVYLAQVKPPTSYRELRTLGAWVGISLPERGRDFFRGRFRDSASYLRRLVSDARGSMRVFAANMSAARNYLPSPWDGRAVLFRAARKVRERDVLINGSRKFIRGGVDVIRVDGNHMTMMMNEKHARVLGEALSRVVAEEPERAMAMSG